MFYMSRKSYRRGIASATALLYQALLIMLLSASILGSGELVANEYGEIDETPMATDPVAQEVAAILPADSAEVMAEEVATSGSTEPEASVSSDEAVPSGEEAVETRTSETAVSAEAEEVGEGAEEAEEIEEAEPTMAEAVVYVFNNDDDTLSISLFIDSELLGTEDVSKEKEKKFGNYELLAGSHNFKITWWDDDTKKTHQEELVATVEGETAVTLYATQNKEPEEFEVNVMLQNENPEDLEAYLYIDGEYEKQKTAKKESITDFGKFDIEEGTHELAVRWQDPETKIEYEKRKTVRVDGKDVVTFYAPAGMTFESDEVAASKATTSKATTSSKTIATTKTAPNSTTTKDEGVEGEPPSKTGTSGSNKPSGEVKSASDKGQSEPESDESKGSAGPDGTNATLYLSTIGAILAIYIIFFRR
jgi:hypothetical protein